MPIIYAYRWYYRTAGPYEVTGEIESIKIIALKLEAAALADGIPFTSQLIGPDGRPADPMEISWRNAK